MALNKMLVGILSVFIAIVVCAGVMAPAISMAEQKTAVIEQSNTSAIGIRFAQQTSDFTLDMSVSMDDQGNITVQNGTDSQTEPYDTMFLMAADNSAIYAGEDGPIAIWTSGGNNYAQVIDDDFTVQLGESNIEIVKGGDTYTLPLPTSYLFVPSSTGYYSSFTNGGLDKLAADPVVAISEVFAGVIAYNDVSVGEPVTEQITGTTTYTDNVKWGAAAIQLDQQNFDPNQIQFDPIIINPLDPGNQIMAIPTPTYTDGDWGYDLDNGEAIIVSYSGSAGDITVPSTVGGYTVKALGKGAANNQNVFDKTMTFTLTISEGITSINQAACRGCTLLTAVNIPSSVTTIGDFAFYECSGITSIELPAVTTLGSNAIYKCSSLSHISMPAVTTIGNSCFVSCTNLTSICIPEGVTSMGTSVFTNSGVNEVLNLSEVEITPGSYGLSNDAVIDDHLDAACYLGHMTEIEIAPGAYNNILAAIPVIVIVAILLATAGIMLLRRE